MGRSRLWGLSGVISLSTVLAMSGACTPAPGAETSNDPVEEEALSADVIDVPITEPNETDTTSALGCAPVEAAATDLIDVRGVGDSAWANTHEETPLAAGWGKALDSFDATGASYRGDLSFVNWETVVGEHCSQFSKPYVPGKSYAFISRAENLTQAYERGFNLIGLSNNHSRDCSNGGGEGTSSQLSAQAIEGLGAKDWLWAGVTLREEDKTQAKVRTFRIKGRDVRVAFASAYTGRASCPLCTCQTDTQAVMASLRDANADLRILSLHSQDSQTMLVKIGMAFVKQYGGDVVFGHGPHVWRPVRVMRKPDGHAGVMFESLGNFLHPALAAQPKNYIGRALYDASLRLTQVQITPVANRSTQVSVSSAAASSVASNLTWSATSWPHGSFANIKP